MKLSYLLKECVPPWQRIVVSGSDPFDDPEITSIHARAQEVEPGGLFIAIKGFSADGHDFINTAFERGAAAVVVQQATETKHKIIEVRNTRKAMASIAAIFYGRPSEKVILLGITGTNGKTTTAWLLESILTAAGIETGVIGTVNVRYKGKTHETPITTPESIDLQKILHDMVKEGVTHVIMEVSSHAVDLNRVDFCDFDIGIFTNLTQDHLDYHKSMKAYWKCKKEFFTRILSKNPRKKGCAVININNEKGRELAGLLKIDTLKTGTAQDADLVCENVQDDINGLKFTLRINNIAVEVVSSLAGGFNLENILCASGAAHLMGIGRAAIQTGVENLKNIPGRLERVGISSGRFIFVDYAHTPDALESILKTLKKRAPARLITVFGCGGDRDPSKRDKMGRIASEYSDIVVVTSDNPRKEDPGRIIQHILNGIPSQAHSENIVVEPDREKALRAATALSRKKDTIVAAGKGHETYQIIKSGKIAFDDREILRKALCDFDLEKEAV